MLKTTTDSQAQMLAKIFSERDGLNTTDALIKANLYVKEQDNTRYYVTTTFELRDINKNVDTKIPAKYFNTYKIAKYFNTYKEARIYQLLGASLQNYALRLQEAIELQKYKDEDPEYFV